MVMLMFQRTRVLRVLRKITPKSLTWLRSIIKRAMIDVHNDTLVFFCKRSRSCRVLLPLLLSLIVTVVLLLLCPVCSPNLFVMNKAMLYIRENEQTSHVAMVHVHPDESNEAVMDAFKRNVVLLNKMYPKFVIDMVGVRDGAVMMCCVVLCCVVGPNADT